MAQSDLDVQNADGATVRADINSQLEALATQNSGSTAPPVTFPFMGWHDTANQQLKERNAANTAWRVVADIVDGELAPYSAGESVETRFVRAGGDIKWLSQPIGVPFGVRDDLAGADVPPTDSSDYRYIKLTASDAYNTGVLASESISGSAPLVVATAVIDYADSPINGETVNLWNTEGRYGKPGTSPGTIANDQMQNVTGTMQRVGSNRVTFVDGTGPFRADNGADAPVNAGTGSNTGKSGNMEFNLALSARTGDSTDVKHQQLTYYMRIA